MTKRMGATMLAALVVVGCSGGSERPAEDGEAMATLDGAARTADSATMAGMDHGGMDHASMTGTGDPQTPGSAGMEGMAHAGMPGSGAAAGTPAMDHSNMPGMRTGGAAAGSAGADHGAMGTAAHATAPDAQGGTAVVDHSRMAAMPATDHARMQASPADRGSTGASQAGHTDAGHVAPVPSGQTGLAAGIDHGDPSHQTPVQGSDDAGMEKLRTLVARLVQDPAVQAQIQADSVLRRGWNDDGVRRIILDRP